MMEVRVKMTRTDWDEIVIPIAVMLAQKHPTSWIIDKIQQRTGWDLDTIEKIIKFVVRTNNQLAPANDCKIWGSP